MSYRFCPTLLVSSLLVLALTSSASRAQEWQTDILSETFGYGPDTPSDVPWNEIQQACGGRDCIPSIDRPRFVPADSADFLADSDLVLALEMDGEARAYPVLILNYHEIVNDVIGGRPIAITYCPLCGSGVAFHRRFDGQSIEFGVSGLLRNNDLILYDRATESLWQQITGRAFAGPLRGRQLDFVPLTLTQWSKWQTAYPDTQVLSIDTGFEKPYANKTPYGDYDSSSRLLFPLSFDRRLHAKTVVHGVETGSGAYAVTEDGLTAAGTLVQRGEPDIRWTLQPSGEVLAVRQDTQAALVPHRMFWFAWYSFHPATKVISEAPASE